MTSCEPKAISTGGHSASHQHPGASIADLVASYDRWQTDRDALSEAGDLEEVDDLDFQMGYLVGDMVGRLRLDGVVTQQHNNAG